jgi:hypothetical protein
MTTFTTADRLAVEATILEKIEELRDSAVYKEYENTYEDGWTDAINEVLSIIDKTTIQEGQNPTQTRYGRLYYETPYRGASTCLFCDGSYECTHGKEPELPCQDDHT